MGFKLRERVVLVTGGSGGIGRACAVAFFQAGARVAVVARSESRLLELERETDSQRVVGIRGDVTSAADRERAIAHVQARWGRIDVLVNNAGWASFGSVLRTPLEDVRRMVELNFVAAVAMIQGVLPGMLERGCGQIINISSVVGYQAIPRMSVYSATKAALISLSTGLRMELRGSGVDVILVAPGSTRTGFFDAAARTDTKTVRFARTQYSAERVARHVVRASLHRKSEVTLSAEGNAITAIRRVSHRLADAIMHQVARRAMPLAEPDGEWGEEGRGQRASC